MSADRLRMGVTLAESTPEHLRLPRAPRGAPNVLVILFDDTGFAQFGSFGADFDTPIIDGLAEAGLRYNGFHVTALCSPTRASILTGRNHHAVGMGFLADMATGFPGYSSRLPKSAGTLPRILRDAGYSTMAVGKWHLTTRGERSAAGPFDRWPLGFGFERYYGFLFGGTNQWTPNLVADNHYVEAPRRPEDGYHLTEDLADSAIRMIQDQKQAMPDKPFFMYWALGATHAPHHVDTAWVEPYHGRYDRGWEAFRNEAFARQLATGVVPEGTTLTPRPSWVQRWEDLSGDARTLFARMHEIYAGFMTHTDAQIGRVIDFLSRNIGELDNTLVLLSSDNGASAEGGLVGSWNEHRFTKDLPETVEDNLSRIDELGGARTYNHYAWGWAWAGNTPFKLWKRYSWLGGTRTPLIVRWPAGITDQGAVRPQFCHAVDVMPTVLEACGLDAPPMIDGVEQQRIDGASLVPTFTDADAPAPRDTQYFEVLGSRSIYHRGWKATTDHIGRGQGDEERLLQGSRDLGTDRWSLHDLRTDFAEAIDLAEAHPEVLEELTSQWWVEAGRNNVLPITDSLIDRASALTPPAYPAPARVVYRPGGSPVADEALPVMRNGFTFTADVVVPPEGPDGIIVAVGDWCSGFAWYGLDGRLVFTLNLFGEVRRTEATTTLPPGPQRLTATYETHGAGSGRLALRDADRSVLAESAIDLGLPVAWQNGGTGLRVGHDTEFPVCDDYAVPFPWTGTIEQVTLEASPAAPPQELLKEALHTD